jgi:hypothetical protein
MPSATMCSVSSTSTSGRKSQPTSPQSTQRASAAAPEPRRQTAYAMTPIQAAMIAEVP